MTGPITAADLGDVDTMADRSIGRGLSPRGAAAKAGLFSRCAAALGDLGTPPEAPVDVWIVPGRIEVLGKHTDYAGGHSLLAATEQGFCMAARPRGDNVVRVVDAGGAARAQFEIDPDLPPESGHWSDYARTVARRLARNFPGSLAGMDLVFCSDLPPAAGMSSSSALVTGVFLALSHRNDLDQRDAYRRQIDSPETMAAYAASIENGSSFGELAGDRGVGTFGGSEDHTAVLCCEAGRLSRYAFAPVRAEGTIAMPEGFVFVVAASGVVADKTGSARDKYNRLSRLAAAAVDLWNRQTDRNDLHLAAALAAVDGDADRIAHILRAGSVDDFTGDELALRFEHFVAESCRIIPAACEALADGDFDQFGRQVDLSQALAESMLGNQTPETSFLARSARELGAPAASTFGAGFGGAVWAMVNESEAETFTGDWAGRYRAEFSDRPGVAFSATPPAPAAWKLGTRATP